MNSKWKRISKSLLLAFGVLAVSPTMFAQPVFPVDFKNHFAAAVFDDARELFNAGQGLYDQGRFLDAERKFRQVVQRFPKNAIADRADYYLIRTLKQLGRKNEALTRIDAFAKTYPASRWLNDVQELRINLTNQIPPAAELVLLRQTPPPPPPLAPPSPPVPPDVGLQNAKQRGERLRGRVTRFQRSPQGQNEDDITDAEVSLQQEIMRAVFFNNTERALEIATERLKSDPADPVVLSNLNMIAVSRSVRALPMLLTIAKNSTNVKARKDAIFWISQSKGDKDVV